MPFKKKDSCFSLKINVYCINSFVFLLLSFFFGSDSFAQTHISADVSVRQLYNNKILRVEKQIFFTSNGNLVVHYTYPQEYYMITNTLGETSVYHPATNEVMYMNDMTLSSQSEIFSLFTPSSSDLHLTDMGFSLQSTKKENDNIVKIFVSDNSRIKDIQKVKLVYGKDRPIYCAFYSDKEKISKKTYFSDYITLPNFSFPTVITQISYDTKGDSVIMKEEFKNIKTDNFSDDALFKYTIPKGTKRVNPY
ncbi:MAG: hypothetical protein IJ681_06050 [Bacteroidales bacterium]|nr:hypothetical protein [Bacteroidales bacterium]